MSQCECGCGKEVKNRFIHGHNNRGKKGGKRNKEELEI